MSRTIELEVGNLYADLHERFSEQVGDQYDERVRREFEEFIHEFNQEVERQVEQAQAEQENLDLSDEDVEELDS